MRGEIDPAVLTPPEAQTLLNQAQAFYLDAKRFEIVKNFHSVRKCPSLSLSHGPFLAWNSADFQIPYRTPRLLTTRKS